MKLKALLSQLLISPVLLSQPTIGLIKNTDCSQDGYILFAPLYSKDTYLIDKCGRQVHKWKSAYTPAQSVYLLPDGNLLRTGNDTTDQNIVGKGGIIEILNWDSEVIWSYKISDSLQRQHHDICPMPNGNILVLVYDKVSLSEALHCGRDSNMGNNWVWSEKIIEIQPIAKDKAKLVWEWRVWDHLIQDRDKDLPNYGVVADNPQLININFSTLKDVDWLHFNSIDYNEQLNEILISNRNFSEVFIIDHSTTTAQAASHKGGRHNKGGDLLFRWGNPQTYNRGTSEDQNLYRQHTARWIKKGLMDEGKIMVFNNGLTRPGETYSTVEIINPPKDEKHNYRRLDNGAYLPLKPDWIYGEEGSGEFYSSNVSNAQRLKNGNTLICEGENGKFFEINKSGDIVWMYVSPVSYPGILNNGDFIKKNQVFRCFLYEPAYAGFNGKKLTAGNAIEDNPVITNCQTGKQKTVDCNLK